MNARHGTAGKLESEKVFADAVVQFTKIVITHAGVTFIALTGETRCQQLFRARGALGYLLQTQLGWGTPRIGKLINRDHCSVMNAVNDFKFRLDQGDPEPAALLIAAGVQRPASPAPTP